MARPSVAIRIGVQGEADIRNSFDQIAQHGGVAAERLRQKFDREMQGVEDAVARANRTAQRLAAVTPNSAGLSNTTNPITGRSYADPNSNVAAMRSAQALSRELDRAEGEARQLIAAIDPLFAAQVRYGEQVARIDALKSSGVLTETRYQQLLQHEKGLLDQATLAQHRHAQGSGLMRAGTQQATFQIQDMATQAASGTRITVIMAQQLPQLAFAMTMIGEAAELSGKKMGRMQTAAVGFAKFMTTAWGAALTGGILLLTAFIPMLGRTGDSHEEAARAARRQRDAEKSLTEVVEEQRQATERLNETSLEALVRRREGTQETWRRVVAERSLLDVQMREALATEERALSSDDPAYARSAVGRVADLQARMADNQRLLEDARRAAAETAFEVGGRIAEAAVDGQAAATLRYEAALIRIENQARREGRTVQWVAEQRLRLIQVRDREIQQARQVSDVDVTGFTRPVPGPVTSGFGVPRPGHRHAGWDMRASVGDPVRAAAAGFARRRNNPTGLGYYVEIDHGRGTRTRYAHLQGYNIPAGGQQVDPGDIIGFVGGAAGMAGRGNSSTPHLHYEVRRGGRAVDPGTGRFPTDPANARSGGGESREEALRRQAAAMQVSTEAAVALARAYLASGDAAIRAEAQREGATDATRRGTEVDEQARRQLALNVAEGAVSGARNVAQLRQENDARAALTSRMQEGGLTAREMQNALQDEAALRPLLQLQAVAQGDALTVLTEIVARYRAELGRAHAEEARADYASAIVGLRAVNDNARTLIGIRGNDRQRSIAEARIAAAREAGERGYSRGDAEDFVDEKAEQARLHLLAQALDQLRGMNESADDRVALLRVELGLGRMGEGQRERILRMEEMRLDLQRRFGPEHEAEIRQILAKAAAEDDLRQRIERVRDAQRELGQIGGSVIDELFNVDNWDDWGEAGLRVLRMLLQEMMVLAAANPLKNWLLGESNPTLGGILRALGVIGGAAAGGAAAGATSAGGAVAGALRGIGGNAAGTHYASGGLSWLAENGPEIVDLPRGAKVTPAAETRRRLAANDGGIGSVSLTFHNDYRGADPAAVARIEADQRRMEAELPARVVAAFEEARSRMIIR